MNEPFFTPSDFVAVLNQTLEYAYPNVTIVGELSNFKISRNKWVYFDLKDEGASVKFFGTIYNLPGPLEEGMVVRVVGRPRMSDKYGFSITIQSIMPEGEGSLKKAADLLREKLEKEGLFDQERKRSVIYPPTNIGLIASKESAAYADFNKVLDARWQGINIFHKDVQVQGEKAVTDVVAAIKQLNELGTELDVIVITRGGGSADDMAAFNTEQVARAIASSRTPTLVAIGHEIDVCLAELVADIRASTPSNSAELMVPSRKEVIDALKEYSNRMDSYVKSITKNAAANLEQDEQSLTNNLKRILGSADESLAHKASLLEALSPALVLARGYAILKDSKGKVIRTVKNMKPGTVVHVGVADGNVKAVIKEVE
jgi:exodeoxyribonuclease VII large subunit